MISEITLECIQLIDFSLILLYTVFCNRKYFKLCILLSRYETDIPLIFRCKKMRNVCAFINRSDCKFIFLTYSLQLSFFLNNKRKKKAKCFKGEIHSYLLNCNIFMMTTSTADFLNKRLYCLPVPFHFLVPTLHKGI